MVPFLLAAALLVSVLDEAQRPSPPVAGVAQAMPDEWSAFMAMQRQQTILTQVPGQNAAVAYDEFYLASREDRQRMFAAMTPPQRAGLAVEHLDRWREKHGYRLTNVQQVLLTQLRGFTARTHNPREWLDPDFNKMFEALSRELQRHFTPAEIRDLCGVDGDYIPK